MPLAQLTLPVRRAFSALREDLPYALRALVRSPGLTFTIRLTFALGVGVNAAVFSVLDRVFFQPPPGIREPNQLLRLHAHQISKDPRDVAIPVRTLPFLTTRDMLELAKTVQGRAQLEGDYLYRRGRTTPDKQQVLVTYVTPGYFPMLGIRMQRGRAFSADESHLPGAPAPVAVISDRYWRRKFARDSNVVGKTIQMDEDTYTIIGVVAPEFEGIELESIDFWAPLSNVENGEITALRVIARVTDGTSTEVLDQLLSKSYREIHSNDLRVAAGSEILTAPILNARGPKSKGTSIPRIPNLTEQSIALLARLGIVGLMVLIISVANVGSLLLMRAVRRRHEIAVRLALGVSNIRLISQLVTESVLLASLAGAAAVGAAVFAGGILRTQLASRIHWSDTVIDQRVIVFAMAIAIVGGCFAGLAPALFALRADVAAWLRSGTVVRAGSRIRSTLLVVQAALCMALLASAGTLLMSLRRAEVVDRGFDVDHTLSVSLPASYASSETDVQRATAGLRAMAEVEAVGRSYTGIKELGFRSKVGLSARDTVGESAKGPWVDFADEQWARSVGARLIAGRWFDSTTNTQPVAVLNESMARALYHGRPIAGTCIRVREPGGGVCRNVIGVIRDIDWEASNAGVQRVYIPLLQAWSKPPTGLIPNFLVVRSRTAAQPGVVKRMQTRILAVAGSSGEDARVQRVIDMLEPQLQPWRLAVKLFLVLGALGLIAAATGIYGLVSFDVTQRTREIGVRLALGAPSLGIVRLVLSASLQVVGYGVAAGLVASLVTGRVMSALLFQTSPYNPMVIAITAAVVAVVTIVASVVPACKATRLSPALALKGE
ncbi:MAG: ABC transporter permease [Gemmatimonadaceae bacterium]